MARPVPIIVPGPSGMGLDQRQLQTRINIGPVLQLLDRFLFKPKREQAAAKALQEFVPTEEVTGFQTPGVESMLNLPGDVARFAGQPTERPALSIEQIVNLGKTPTGAAALKTFLGEAIKQRFGQPEERRIVKDVAGFQRFPDTGERVFPGVEVPEAKVTPAEKLYVNKAGDLQWIDVRNKEAVKTARGGGYRPVPTTAGKDIPTAETALRKEFTTLSKVFRDVRDSYQRVIASAENPSPAGDLALIFNFMKILDPGSVVRESEFATAEKAQEWTERHGISFAAIGRVWRGERLSTDARADFVSRARSLFNKQAQQHTQRETTFRRLAIGQGLSPENVVIEITAPPQKFTQEDLEFTAKEEGITVEEVKRRLGVK